MYYIPQNSASNAIKQTTLLKWHTSAGLAFAVGYELTRIRVAYVAWALPEVINKLAKQ